MQPKTKAVLLAFVAAGVAVLAVSGSAVLGGEGLAVDPALAASATADSAGVEAAKADPAATAMAKKMEKVKKLGCFQCHNFEHYLNGRPKVAKPPGGPVAVAPPEGACGSPGHECKAAPPANAVAKAEEGEGNSDEAAVPKAAGAAAVKAGADGADDEDAQAKDKDDKAEEDQAEGEEEEEEAPPNPKDFAHKLHEEEGVGHCHQCHAMEGHFQVKVRMQACAECH